MNTKRWTRVGASFLAAMMLLPAASGFSASADQLAEIEQRQQEIQQKLDQANANLAAMQGKADQQEAYQAELANQLKLSQEKIDLMGEQVLAMSASITEKQEQIALQEEQIAETEELLEAAEAEINETYEQFQVRMRSLYMASEFSGLEMLLSADSYADFLYSTRLMQAVSRSDSQLIDQLRSQKTTLEDQKTVLEDQKAQLEADVQDLQVQRETLTGQQSEIRTAQDALQLSYEENADILADYESQLSQAQSDRDSLRAEAEQVEAEMQAWFAEQARLKAEEEARRKAEEERKKQEEEERRKQEEAEKAQQEQDSSSEDTSSEETSEPDTSTSEEETDDTSDSGVHTNFAWPLSGFTTVWCPYGQQDGYFHYGMDISGGGINGAPILAAESGTVILATSHYSYGNYVIIDHGGGYTTLYAHASSLLVSVGQQVTKGQTIATVGSTGNSTGPHLHFEVRINGQTQNPLGFVSP